MILDRLIHNSKKWQFIFAVIQTVLATLVDVHLVDLVVFPSLRHLTDSLHKGIGFAKRRVDYVIGCLVKG
jgi:hypothetical protein